MTEHLPAARQTGPAQSPAVEIAQLTADLRRALNQVANGHADLAFVQSDDGEESLVYSCPPVLLAEDVLAGAYPSLRSATSRAAEKRGSPSSLS
ncbi:hypothetical protein ACG2OD_00320 [Streptomyces sp. PDY-4]|uniref:hypothetical protein n=1 Tax=Streptomyces sp. PDY-4 TaxID=3376070 RepID=UPI00378D847A